MQASKNTIIGILFVALVVLVGIMFLIKQPSPEPEVALEPEPQAVIQSVPTSTQAVIGTSVEGRDIEVYRFGTGDTQLLFVGGVHGGYEWNSVLLAYEFIDYFSRNHSLIPKDISVAIIPNLNPDAIYEATGREGRFEASDVVTDASLRAAARFNANDVDLNRNFDCKWQPESTWRGNPVSAGTAAFSEPEAAALRDYVTEAQPDAVIFWHSQADTVYASECEAGVIPETLEIMDAYAAAANYKTQATFDAYPITGDAEGWLASIGIPAITVEFKSHESMDWTQNLRGVSALLNYYQAKLAR